MVSLPSPPCISSTAQALGGDVVGAERRLGAPGRGEAGVENVVAMPADENVRADAAVQAVVIVAADEDVVAALAAEDVVPGPAVEQVVALAAVKVRLS